LSHKLPAAMHWQIYPASLAGPHALFRLFEQAFGQAALSSPPAPDHQHRTIDDLSAQIAGLKGQIERLQAETRELRVRCLQLQRRNRELQAQFSKDSHNSSRPPSTDPPWSKRTRSLRGASGKLRGGQAGHQGETRRLTARPDRIVEHWPEECRRCHSPLVEGQLVRHLKQQVMEVVPAKLRVTEHRLDVVRCSACGKRRKGEFALGDLVGRIRLRVGWKENKGRVCSRRPLRCAVRAGSQSSCALPPAVSTAARCQDQ
jgi:uncharacterized coiled-coil protein SlyX